MIHILLNYNLSEKWEGYTVTPDGKEIWTTNNRDNSISVVNTNTLEVTNTLITEEQTLRLKLTPDEKKCIAASAQQGSIGVYNSNTKVLMKNQQLPGKDNLFEKVIYYSPHLVGVLIHLIGKYTFIAISNADRIAILGLKKLKHSAKTVSIADGVALIS